MKKQPTKVQRRVKNERDATKRMIAEMKMTRGCSKINSKRSANYVAKTVCYSNVKTITTYALVSVQYSRKKQKDMLLKGKIPGGKAIEYRHSAFLNW